MIKKLTNKIFFVVVSFYLSFIPENLLFAMNNEVDDNTSGGSGGTKRPPSPVYRDSSDNPSKKQRQLESTEEGIKGDSLKKLTFTKPQNFGLSIDNTRELFYKGTSLSDFPSIDKEKFKKTFCKNSSIGYFEATPPQSGEQNRQNLLLSADHENKIFQDAQLMNLFKNKTTSEQDRRERVDYAYESPWNAITSLEITYHTYDDAKKQSYSSTYYGSGILLKKRFVLTAAHNIYDDKTGFLPISVTAIPGLDNGIKYWEGTTNKYYIDPEYFSDSTQKNDIALVDFGDTFDKVNIDIFQPGIKYVQEADLKDTTLRITGFPGGAIINSKIRYLACQSMMTSEGSAKSVKDGIISYDIDTTKGNSGSPIYFEKDDEIFCCGVHSGYYGNKVNEGAHLTKEKIQLITKSWMKL